MDHFFVELFRGGTSSHLLNELFMLITTAGDKGLVWLGVAFGLILTKESRRYGIMLVVSIALCAIVSDGVLKHLLMRARPFVVYHYDLLIPAPTSSSFPSGHSTSSFCAATFLSYFFRKWSWVLYAIAAIIAFSRIYLGVHYMSDVLTGAVLGVIIGFAVAKITQKHRLLA